MPFPKTDHYEKYMSPLKMFEYMSAGKPIVASKLPTIEEVLEDRKTAHLVEPGDAGDIARAVSEVINERQDAERMSTAAKAKGRKYSWANRVRHIMDHYRSIE